MEGLGQGAAHFTDPADSLVDVGAYSWGDAIDLDAEHPMIQGPAAGSMPEDLSATGLVRVSASATPQAPEVSGSQHWSNLLNWRANPMPWLLVLLIMVLGLASVQAAVRVGR